MHAYVLQSVNQLCYKEIDKPSCPRGWAIIRVKAAGICSSDIDRIFYKGTYHFPTIPGHEFSGIVESVGDEKDDSLIGKRVGIFPLIPCKECSQCKDKHYEMCINYDYLGSRRDGGFAELVAVPIWNIIEIPESMPFVIAAMLEPISVARHAIECGKIEKGNSVGIIGSGMIAISAAQWAYAMGAKDVTIIGRTDSKRKLIENCGINYLVCNDADHVNQFDMVLEAVGSQEAINMAINAAASGSKIVLMGNPTGNIVLPQNTYWRILRKQLSVYGTWNSQYDGKNPSDWTATINSITAGDIKTNGLISHVFNQENLVDGLKIMKDHTEPYCKIMTIWNK